MAWYVRVHLRDSPTTGVRAARTLPRHRAREIHRWASRIVEKVEVGGGGEGVSRTRKDVASGITSPGKSA
jgi:hypothetical protein